MEMNIGNVDRIVRAIVGLALLSLVVIGPQTLWGLLGVIPLATAVVGFCPVYKAFGISTNPMTLKHR